MASFGGALGPGLLQRWHLSRGLRGVGEALRRGFAVEEPARAGAHLQQFPTAAGITYHELGGLKP